MYSRALGLRCVCILGWLGVGVHYSAYHTPMVIKLAQCSIARLSSALVLSEPPGNLRGGFSGRKWSYPEPVVLGAA